MMMEMVQSRSRNRSSEYIVGDREEGLRLDQFLARRVPALSRNGARAMIVRGGAYINRRRVKICSRSVRQGDRIRCYQGAEGETAAKQVTVLFRDDTMLAVDKPAGMVVQATPVSDRGHLIDIVSRQLEPEVRHRLRLLHRLDRETSGVVLLALKPMAYRLFQPGQPPVKKTYLAILDGIPRPLVGVIESELGRDFDRPGHFISRPGGKVAITEYQVICSRDPFSLTSLQPHSGRTHQLRVHMADLGCPVLGDHAYHGRNRIETGIGPIDLPRLLLHAWRVSFRHPVSGVETIVTAPVPIDLHELSVQLKLSLPEAEEPA